MKLRLTHPQVELEAWAELGNNPHLISHRKGLRQFVCALIRVIIDENGKNVNTKETISSCKYRGKHNHNITYP
jgi:hypothetical protein